MSDPAHAQPDPGPPAQLGASRSRVLEALQDAPGALGIDDVSALVGLHPNTIRFHLDGLVEGGRAQRSAEGRTMPGRPRMLYTASPDPDRVGRRSYRLLAELLAGAATDGDAAGGDAAGGEATHGDAAGPTWDAAIIAAGRGRGRQLAAGTSPRRSDAAGAIDELCVTLDRIGFAPKIDMRGNDWRVLLRHCPFLEVAQSHRDVVCSAHLGLMQGLLEGGAAAVRIRSLEPFATPSVCVAELAVGPVG